jgi:hypothetical protein
MRHAWKRRVADRADVRLSMKTLRFSPSGMQLIAKYRISSLDFRSMHRRHLMSAWY